MSTEQNISNARIAARISARLRGEGDIRLRRTFGCPAFYVNGRMFACVHRGNVTVKLPRAQVAALLRSSSIRPFQPTERAPMRSWCQLVDGRVTPDEEARLLVDALRWARGGHHAA